ncbi:MAG: ABC transporter ATP-binding protein [Treponema sp.]|uniref:ABC transporter ATP-binding protein n=1 Tax=Treponema sp. TaxID=166 RepID=UPI0025E98099|nr:ABC transporter ATP-binding protein [Treponema sp.]MBQ9282633.1 ABC transporter ATP-binding protein [Treponema sp.]
MPPVKMRGTQKPRNTKKTILRLVSYMGRFKTLWIFVFFFVILSALAEVAGAYLLKPAINDYILPLIGKKNPDLSGFVRLIVTMIAVYVTGALASYGSERILISISTNTLCALRKDLFHHMEKLPLRYYDSHQHGVLMSLYTNDTDTLREMFSMSVPQLFSTFFQVTGIFIMMCLLSIPLTLLVILTIALIMILSAEIGKRSGKAFRRQQENIGRVNGYIEELIEGQRVVKVFTKEGDVQKKFDALNEDLRKAGTSAMSYVSVLGPMMNNLSHIQYALTAILGSFLVIKGFSDVGTIASFLQSTRSFSRPLTQVSQQFNSVLNALAGAERIFAAIDEEIESDDGKIDLGKHPKGDFQLKNVTFSYKEGRPVLRNISLHARPGEKIALVGSTGSGKTTITNLLTRFYDIEEGSGEILYDGIPLKSIKKDSLRRSLGMVLQDTHLFTGTIFDNIRYGKLDATREEVIAAAKLANADYFISHLSNGYDTEITGDGSSLSAGQRQLLAIARASVANPPVLILDEATSSIDTRTERLIQKGMDSLMCGRTVFVIAHRLSTVRNADEILVLEKGEIIERGNHDALMEKKGRYYDLYTGAFKLE